MTMIAGIVVALAAIAALAWWINIGSARRHWRQAHEFALRQMHEVPPRTAQTKDREVRMSDMLLANPHFWTDRASELRAVAETVRPGPQREQLLRLADLDEALAARARQGARPLDSLATIPILQPRVGDGRDG